MIYSNLNALTQGIKDRLKSEVQSELITQVLEREESRGATGGETLTPPIILHVLAEAAIFAYSSRQTR